MAKNIQVYVMNKPNLFLIGAPKCGTTALAVNLSQHKDIFLPKQKEPRYFDRKTFYDDENEYMTKTLDEYLAYYMDAKNEKYLLDGSVFNMYSQESIENILKLSPDAKFIIIIRDPVEASLSMHRQRLTYVNKKMREVSEDFMECWNLLEERRKNQGYPKGCQNKFLFRYDALYSYEKYLPYLIDRLGEQLFIGFYDEYKTKPDLFFDKLFTFLKIENIRINNKKMNESLVVKNSILLQVIESILKHTLPIRKKIGLIGLKNIKRKFLERYKQNEKSIFVNQKVYDFFEPTYQYMEKLKNEINSKNSK